MGRFVIHGILVEEPKRSVTTGGMDFVTLVVEEKYRTPFAKEIVNVYSIDFIGKAVNCIPGNTRLIGCPVVVTGNIRSRKFKDRYYNDLNGDTLTVIPLTTSFVSHSNDMYNTSVSEQAPAPEDDGVVVASNVDGIDIKDDDLPF